MTITITLLKVIGPPAHHTKNTCKKNKHYTNDSSESAILNLEIKSSESDRKNGYYEWLANMCIAITCTFTKLQRLKKKIMTQIC